MRHLSAHKEPINVNNRVTIITFFRMNTSIPATITDRDTKFGFLCLITTPKKNIVPRFDHAPLNRLKPNSRRNFSARMTIFSFHNNCKF